MRPLLLTLGWLALAAPAAAAPAAPAFSFTELDGSGHFDSRALLGKRVMVIRFQASWCKICNQEAAAIRGFFDDLRQICNQTPVVLLFDTYEKANPELADWLEKAR